MKPLTLSRATALFLLPSIALAVILYLTIPLAIRGGMPLALAVTTQFLLFMGGLGALAWIGARHDRARGQRITERLRLVRPRPRDLLTGLLLGVFMLATYTALSFTGAWLRQVGPFGPPAWFAEFMTATHFQGIPLAGNWWAVVLYFVQYVFNVVGEELWWRGYILPRQELSLGHHSWLANGLLWNLFHWFFYWNMIALLPSCLALSWLTQRTRNTWTGILGHGVLNGAGLVAVAIRVVNS